MSENIDKIIYINLDKRIDKLEEINNELKIIICMTRQRDFRQYIIQVEL